MRRELEERLCEDFPDLFRQYSYSKGSYYALYMACGDGWEPIIRRLSQRITKIVETIVGPHPNSADTSVSSEIEDQLEVEGGSRVKLTKGDFRFMYIKQKYGILHLYLSHCTPDLQKAMNEARLESECTCERCGRPGKFGGPSWPMVFCDHHGFDDRLVLNF
jgi:hypothetical protein